MAKKIDGRTAKQAITEFLSSEHLGVSTEFSRAELQRAAESLFTAKGQNCPVMFMNDNGTTYIVKREVVS